MNQKLYGKRSAYVCILKGAEKWNSGTARQRDLYKMWRYIYMQYDAY